ncbi:hypothetical protein AB0904_27920 [Streptomyces sp. NPDC006684]|uniref:hypothetical protein n=1 Tax=Streptomyces sp. NPDC006684 TaxID=3154477 RepID=UPI0034526008
MFGLSRTRTVRHLRDRLTAAAEEIAATREKAASNLAAAVRTSEHYRSLHDRLTAAETDAARLRRDLARLQARYDDAVGITSPAVEMGEHWQTRRTDKPLPEVSS